MGKFYEHFHVTEATLIQLFSREFFVPRFRDHMEYSPGKILFTSFVASCLTPGKILFTGVVVRVNVNVISRVWLFLCPWRIFQTATSQDCYRPNKRVMCGL